eukprot:scaffold313180_cov22-Tisochrysis_lutea.AAC.1
MELDDGQEMHTTTSKLQPASNSTEDTASSHQRHPPPVPPSPSAGDHTPALIQATKDKHALRLGLNTTLPKLLGHTQIALYPHYAPESHTLKLTSPNNKAAALLQQARSVTLTERGASTITMACMSTSTEALRYGPLA